MRLERLSCRQQLDISRSTAPTAPPAIALRRHRSTPTRSPTRSPTSRSTTYTMPSSICACWWPRPWAPRTAPSARRASSSSSRERLRRAAACRRRVLLSFVGCDRRRPLSACCSAPPPTLLPCLCPCPCPLPQLHGRQPVHRQRLAAVSGVRRRRCCRRCHRGAELLAATLGCSAFVETCRPALCCAPLHPSPSPSPLSTSRVDEADYEDPEKINQAPLSFEGLAPSMSLFVLLWVTAFTLLHSG